MTKEILNLTIEFHNTYERLAKEYNYKTREDTKKFNIKSSNGKLMYATVSKIVTPILYENKKFKKEKQELIDYLKNLLENRYTNSKVVWFDSEYAKIYGELCTMAGANDDRLPLVPLSEIENILSKIEKR